MCVQFDGPIPVLHRGIANCDRALLEINRTIPEFDRTLAEFDKNIPQVQFTQNAFGRTT